MSRDLAGLREVLAQANVSLDDCYDEAADLQLGAVPPEERKVPKLAKVQAGYTNTPGKHQCGECWMYIQESDEEGRCAITDGTIKAIGTCNYWKKGSYMAGESVVENSTKLGQNESGYMERADGFACATCSRFRAPNACAVVYGTINPQGCCAFWSDQQPWVP